MRAAGLRLGGGNSREGLLLHERSFDVNLAGGIGLAQRCEYLQEFGAGLIPELSLIAEGVELVPVDREGGLEGAVLDDGATDLWRDRHTSSLRDVDVARGAELVACYLTLVLSLEVDIALVHGHLGELTCAEDGVPEVDILEAYLADALEVDILRGDLYEADGIGITVGGDDDGISSRIRCRGGRWLGLIVFLAT